MTRRDDASRLKHIVEATEKTIRFTRGKKRHDLDSDELLKLALLQLLQIIGEAASGVSDRMKENHPEIRWRDMKDARNRLIHGYDEVNIDIVWNTVTKELPPLLKQMKSLLKSLESK
jgi:uncharacterized protein with HEPN domain